MFIGCARCDECGQCYHLTCLDPPLKKSPKLRGYAWLCTACSMGNDDNDTNPGKSPEDDGTNGDTGRKPRRRRNSPSVYGTVPSASPGGRGSRRDAGQAAGSNRHRWNRRRLLQKLPPTLESHMLVNPEVGGLRGWDWSTGVTPLGGAENRSGYEAEEGISECCKDKQHQSESSSGGHAKTSAFAGRGTHEPSESSAAKVGIDAKKADADVGRKKECTKVGSTEVTSDRRPGVGHAESATPDGVCVDRKVDAPAEKTRAKRLKNLGDIVAKLRTENEKAQQPDTNNSN
ncbi:hypothetical protein LSAT2_012674 [Lamellibrachia satsuma]|nr:hypothetical protein LSAT2_012674 [Lamellibrachia satsuma]